MPVQFVGFVLGKIRKIASAKSMEISSENIASHLGVTKETIRNWIKKTDIPAHKIGKLWKFKLSELDAWVKSGNSALD